MRGGGTVSRDQSSRSVELTEEQMDIIFELVVRGMLDTSIEPEYGEAFDAFVKRADYPLRIGDLPERVREVWFQ